MMKVSYHPVICDTPTPKNGELPDESGARVIPKYGGVQGETPHPKWDERKK